MSGRIVFVREGWQLRPSETATADDYAAWVKNGAPPAPTAADIDALVSDQFLGEVATRLSDMSQGGDALALLNNYQAREFLGAALRELLGVK